MPTWIDFKELRAKLDFEKVLSHYGVKVCRKGEQHMGPCPLPGHSGKRNAPSFSANLERGIFQCFVCSQKGNALDFAVLMEKERPDDGRAVKKVAAHLRATFLPDDAALNGRKPASQPELEDKQFELGAVVNEPLDFELKGLDSKHQYLSDSGLSEHTISHFGLGFCSRGYFKERIAIPLHNAQGKLVGYAGWLADQRTISENNPEYLFPEKRERDGQTLEFDWSLFLYHGWRLKPGNDIVVVSEFASVWWLHDCGFSRVVATMADECSDEQARLIVELVTGSGHVRLMADGSDRGACLVRDVCEKVSPDRFVRWARLPKGTAPTDLSSDELRTFFAP